MDNPNLPFEYQSTIDAESRRQALAQALLKQTMGFKGAESQGKMASKTSPLSWMANAVTQYLANKSAEDAGQGVAKARDRFGADQAAEITRVLGLGEDEQIPAAAGSRFPGAQALAKTLQDQRMKRLEGYGGALKEADPQESARAFASGKVNPGYTLAPAEPTQFGADSAGNQYSITHDRKKQPTLKYAPKGVQVNNVMPGNEAKMGLDVLESGLKPREEAAIAARQIYATTSQAVDALSRGAQAGGGEAWKQTARKVIQAFGTTMPETATTEQLSQALGNTLLSEAAKIKPISNTDIATLEKIVGSISTDPTALSKALAFSQAIALDAMHNFDRYVTEQEATVANPVAKQRLAGVRIGREAPKSLTGPTDFQLSVIQAMQNAGLDISRFNDPTGVPFSQNSKFKVNPAGSFPTAGKAPDKIVDFASLPPAEQQRILQLLQGGKK